MRDGGSFSVPEKLDNCAVLHYNTSKMNDSKMKGELGVNPNMEFAIKTAQAYNAVCKPLCQELKLPQTAFDILMFLGNNPDYKTASEIVLGNTDAVNLPDIKGRFLYKVGNETIEFQSFYFDDETMLHEVCVDQGEMLTEAPVYKVPEHKIPVRKNENKKAEVVRSGRKEKKVTAVKTSGEEKNSYEDPFVGMNSREIEEEMRRMDEEDLNLNFGDF